LHAQWVIVISLATLTSPFRYGYIILVGRTGPLV